MPDYGLEVFDPALLQKQAEAEAAGVVSPVPPAGEIPVLPDGERLEYKWEGDVCTAYRADGSIVGDFRLQMLGDRYIYNDALADFISELVMDGCTFKEIAQRAHMPRALQLQFWFNTKKDFREKVLLARQLRAETAAQAAIKAGAKGESTSKDFVTGLRLAVDTLKWEAEKYDPEMFGTRTKVVGDVNAPLSLIIETGIRRAGDPGYQGGVDVARGESALNDAGAEDGGTLSDLPADDVGGGRTPSLLPDAGDSGSEPGEAEDSDSTP